MRRADSLLALECSWITNSSMGTCVRKLKLTSMFYPVEEGEPSMLGFMKLLCWFGDTSPAAEPLRRAALARPSGDYEFRFMREEVFFKSVRKALPPPSPMSSFIWDGRRAGVTPEENTFFCDGLGCRLMLLPGEREIWAWLSWLRVIWAGKPGELERKVWFRLSNFFWTSQIFFRSNKSSFIRSIKRAW